MDLDPIIALCHRNWDELQPDGPLGSYADFTLPCLPVKMASKTVIRPIIANSYFTLEMTNLECKCVHARSQILRSLLR